jgi:type I site-specific restriction-modification system R (restriction) subunit
VIEELIQLAKDIRAARARGEETGLTDEEITFYDALAENESARQVMGDRWQNRSQVLYLRLRNIFWRSYATRVIGFWK